MHSAGLAEMTLPKNDELVRDSPELRWIWLGHVGLVMQELRALSSFKESEALVKPLDVGKALVDSKP